MKLLVYLQKHGLPAVAILVGVTAALSGLGRRNASTARAEPAPLTNLSPARAEPVPGGPALPVIPSVEEAASAGQSISGTVLEQIDVEKYSYLRLGDKGSKGTWAAVPISPSHLGERVTVTNAEVMTQFASATLKRTFEIIYFGVLEGPGSAAPGAVNSDAAPGAVSEPSHAPAPFAEDGASLPPHPGAGPGADRVAVGPVKRASGPLARTVAELNASNAENTGAKARVRAVVVKSTSGVMGRTFLHVRDGSGEASAGSNDLAVTTSVEAALGSELVLEGTIVVDQDFGSGYRYHVLLADATLVAE